MSTGRSGWWDNVAAARDAGVSIAFLSGGNSVAGKVYLNPSTDGRPHRVFGRIEHFDDEQELLGASSTASALTDWTCVSRTTGSSRGTGMKQGDAILGWSAGSFTGRRCETIRSRGAGRGKANATMGAIRTRQPSTPGPKGNFVFNAAIVLVEHGAVEAAGRLPTERDRLQQR